VKQCASCNLPRPDVLFAKGKAPLSPSRNVCQRCADEEADDVAVYNRQRGESYRWTSNVDVWLARRAKALVSKAKTRAQMQSLPFDLTPEWAFARLAAGKCEITGIQFLLDAGSRRWTRNNFTPSIERVSHDLGYVKDNCLMVVWIYNSAKGTGSHDDVVKFARAVVAASNS
jgi:hypothetical protein